MYFLKQISLLVGIIFAPIVVLAAPSNFGELIKLMNGILNKATEVLFGLVVMFFMWNTMKGLFGEQNAESKKKQGQAMTWGIIILFIMTSFWGILHMLQMLLMHGFK